MVSSRTKQASVARRAGSLRAGQRRQQLQRQRGAPGTWNGLPPSSADFTAGPGLTPDCRGTWAGDALSPVLPSVACRSQKDYCLRVETVNPTSIASLKEWLNRTQADVICVQELRADEAMLQDASRWLGCLGWNYLWTPSVRTEAGGLSAGVAILARDWLALRSPHGGSEVVPSRAVAGVLHPPGFREFVVYSLYCW